MASWAAFQAEAPELAERARRALDAHGHKTVATLRRDGSPRICGTELASYDGELWLAGMPGALRFADLRRDPRAHAPGHHEPGEHGPELADHRAGDEASDVLRRAEGLQLHRRLQREHHPGEEPREKDDAERLHAERVHLLDEIACVKRAGKGEAKRVPRQEEHRLDGGDARLRRRIE